jgi:hypothetical protein
LGAALGSLGIMSLSLFVAQLRFPQYMTAGDGKSFSKDLIDCPKLVIGQSRRNTDVLRST